MNLSNCDALSEKKPSSGRTKSPMRRTISNITMLGKLFDAKESPFSGFAIIITFFILDVIIVCGAYAVSYSCAAALPPLQCKVWKLADAIFGAGILYLQMASGAYRRAELGNPFAQISRLLVHGSMIAFLEWMGLWIADLTARFDWPFYGPLNIMALAVVVMCLVRVGIFRLLKAGAKRGLIAHRVVIVGAGDQGERLIRVLKQRKAPWTLLVGIFDDRIRRYAAVAKDFPASGTIQDLLVYSRSHRIDEILVALPWGAENRLLHILRRLKEIPANINLAPDAIGHHFLERSFDRIDGVPIFNVYGKPISGWNALVKRAEDVFLGSLILVVALPIMAVCALAIRLDSPGPILFRQSRYGYNNNLIRVFKFRSMYHNMSDANCDRQTTRTDPRITRVGAFLRRTSLDELPQLINVLRGEMSLVGPRPHAVNTKAAGRLFGEVVQEYAARHRVKPGITGWAQVSGWRGETDTEEKIIRRVECDLYYMENWSLFLDIEILFRTVAVLTGKNAY